MMKYGNKVKPKGNLACFNLICVIHFIANIETKFFDWDH